MAADNAMQKALDGSLVAANDGNASESLLLLLLLLFRRHPADNPRLNALAAVVQLMVRLGGARGVAAALLMAVQLKKSSKRSIAVRRRSLSTTNVALLVGAGKLPALGLRLLPSQRCVRQLN